MYPVFRWILALFKNLRGRFSRSARGWLVLWAFIRRHVRLTLLTRAAQQKCQPPSDYLPPFIPSMSRGDDIVRLTVSSNGSTISCAIPYSTNLRLVSLYYQEM